LRQRTVRARTRASRKCDGDQRDGGPEEGQAGCGKVVLLDFWATWCGPCKMLAPVIEQIADEKTGSLKVLKMDVDENNVTAQRFGIMSIPTMILFKDGKPVKQLVGYQSKDKILSQIGQFLPAKTV